MDNNWVCGIDTHNQTVYTNPSNNTLYIGESFNQEFELDSNYKDIKITYSQDGQIKVVKDLDDLTILNNRVYVTLTESDTLALINYIPVICKIETKFDDMTTKCKQLLYNALYRKQHSYIAYAYAMWNTISVVQISTIELRTNHYMLLTLNDTWKHVDFDVIFKDEYNHEIVADKVNVGLNKCSVVIPTEVLEYPGKVYICITSDVLNTCYSNALRVGDSWKED